MSASIDSGPTTGAIVPSHGGGRIKPWTKGQSGNPTGKLGEYHHVRRLCADKSVEATRVLFELLDSDDDRVRFMAVKEIYDRGIGKPRDHSNEQGGKIDLSALSPEERASMVELLKKAMGL